MTDVSIIKWNYAAADENRRRAVIRTIGDAERRCFADAWSEDMLAESLRQPYNDLWIAEQNAVCCGYLLANRIADETELLRTAVCEEHRRCGIGQMLISAYLNAARESCVRAILEVRHGNTAAKNLYEKNGYRLLATRKNYYQNPAEDADIYEHAVR